MSFWNSVANAHTILQEYIERNGHSVFYFQSLIMYVILMLFYNLSTICALFLLLIEETCFLGGM